MTEAQSSLRHYLRVLRRQAWLILLVAVVATGTASLATWQQEPIYRASSKIVVGQGGGLVQPQFGNTVEPFTQTITTLFKSDIVARTVVANLGLRIAPEQLLEDVRVSTRPESSVLEVSYDSPSKSEAVAVLSEMSRVFAELVEQRLGAAPETVPPGEEREEPITANVFDPAHLEPDVVAPRPVRNVTIAALLGLALGTILGFARDTLDDRIRGRREAEQWFRAPVVGMLPPGARGKPATELANGKGRRSEELAEALHVLGANVQFAQSGLGGPAILVTSALPQEGKSTLVANLGVTLALAGKDVICVEADLRRPKLNQYLQVQDQGSGLVDVMEGVPLEEALVDVELPAQRTNGRVGRSEARPAGRLRVVLAGHVESSPATVFAPDRVGQLIQRLSSEATYVIVDAPPLLVVADAFPFALKSDSVLVVARHGRTTRENAETVASTLEGLGVQRIGVVLTDTRASDGYGYGYGYRYSYRSPSS